MNLEVKFYSLFKTLNFKNMFLHKYFKLILFNFKIFSLFQGFVKNF